jgi:flagellar biogenesis protein FliO
MDTLTLLLQVGVVFGLLGAFAWVVRRHAAKARGAHHDAVTVLARTPLARGAQLAVVRVGEATFALGVTEHQVTNLGEVDLPTPPEPDPAAPAAVVPARPALEGTFRERFVTALQAQGPIPRGFLTAWRRTIGATLAARRPAPAMTGQGRFSQALAGALADQDRDQSTGQGQAPAQGGVSS